MSSERSNVLEPCQVLYLPAHKHDGDSFMSGDSFGRVSTATGALWRPDGRYFDGEDDDITVPNNSLFTSDNLTVLLWAKVLALPDTDYETLISVWDTASKRSWLLSGCSSARTKFTVSLSDNGSWSAGHIKQYYGNTFSTTAFNLY